MITLSLLVDQPTHWAPSARVHHPQNTWYLILELTRIWADYCMTHSCNNAQLEVQPIKINSPLANTLLLTLLLRHRLPPAITARHLVCHIEYEMLTYIYRATGHITIGHSLSCPWFSWIIAHWVNRGLFSGVDDFICFTLSSHILFLANIFHSCKNLLVILAFCAGLSLHEWHHPQLDGWWSFLEGKNIMSYWMVIGNWIQWTGVLMTLDDVPSLFTS